ncbi:aminotransferase class III-fold pyridoxal phosphate-dependent enzyme [Bacteroidota bacterium]
MILAIVQARLGSTRLPAKVLKKINGKSLIEILLYRLSLAKKIDKIVLATAENSENDELANHVEKLGYEVYRGSENDVLDRYYQAAKKHKPDSVVRITGDCPLIDPDVIDAVINNYQQNDVDYASNTLPPTFPDGLDLSIFSYKSLLIAWEQATSKYDREHVTPFIRFNNQFKRINLSNKEDLSGERWTVDEPVDFEVISRIFNHFAPRLDFSWLDVLNLKNSHPEYFEDNKNISRNEGSTMDTGQKLWKRAKRIIPGGSQLLSKRPEMFLPDYWPSYYSRAKGCRIWDLDDNCYLDMSLMGVGSCTLGYADEDVDGAVIEAVGKGNMSSLNVPEEIELAELLCELHPWAGMVRYARTGGEAVAVAIRIARAYTKKDIILFGGYHGWSDWYLSSNIQDKSNLDKVHLTGLEPNGVPQALKGTSHPFFYNDTESFKKLIEKYGKDVGGVIIESVRSKDPDMEFIKTIRELTSENGIPLIIDEISAGWRMNPGGAHLIYDIHPDIAVFAKGMSNGYPMAAIIGKSPIMEAAQTSFISSTYWTDRIGPVAALATINKYIKVKAHEKMINSGQQIKKIWKEQGIKHGLDINVGGIDPIAHFGFNYDNPLVLKTLYTQAMLELGIMASTAFYASYAHEEPEISLYSKAADESFKIISEAIQTGNPRTYLKGPVCHSGFQRLT